MTVFLDTVGLIALWDESDQWHSAAEEAFGRLAQARAVLVTTPWVLAETANAAARRSYRQSVARLWEGMKGSSRLLATSSEELNEAWQAYARGEAGGAGLVDQISFLAMRRLNLRDAFTNDAHFRAAGFNTLF